MSDRYTVDLTAAARDDLAAIGRWLRDESGIDVAERLLDAILDRVEPLERFPLRGSLVPELAVLGFTDYRQMPVAPYRLIYRVHGDRVTIRLIAHARRNFIALLEERVLR